MLFRTIGKMAPGHDAPDALRPQGSATPQVSPNHNNRAYSLRPDTEETQAMGGFYPFIFFRSNMCRGKIYRFNGFDGVPPA